MSTFYSVQRRNSGIEMPISLHEKKTGYKWDTICRVDVHLKLTPLCMRPSDPDSPPPPCGRYKWMAPN